MKWAHPQFLFGIVVFSLALGSVWFRLKRKTFHAFLRVALDPKPGVLKSVWRHPRFLAHAGFALAGILLSLALARPQRSFQKVNRTVEGIDILLTLDLSASMRIEDFRDQSRIELAKEVLTEFIQARESDRIGLVAFSGEPVTLAPPTLDYGLVKQQLELAEPGDLKDGTAIGDGLSLAVTRLSQSQAKTKILILVTDGDNNMGQVDPLTAGELAKGFGVKVYSVAIGREGRVRMPFVQKDLFGRPYRTYQYFDNSINPELLKRISENTGGKFYRVEDDPKVFREVFADINRLEKTAVTTTEQVRYTEHFQSYVLWAFFLTVVMIFAQMTRWRVVP